MLRTDLRVMGALAVLLLLRTTSAAQEPQIAWEPDFDAALKAAKADGKPLMFAFIMDEEPACDAVTTTHFHDKNIVAASEHFHCLVASVGIHAATSAEGVCPKFGCNTCAAHQRIQMRSQIVYLQSSRVSAPQFLFLKSDGETVLLRHVWQLSPSELLKKMQLALMFADPSKADEAAKHASAEVTEAIETAGTSKDPYKRSMALMKLSSLDDPRIMDFLIKQTGENVETDRRLEAIDAMGSRGNAKALPALVKQLKSKLPQVRNRGAMALEKLAMLDAAEPLLAAFKAELNEGVKGNMLRALVICDGATPEHQKLVLSTIDSGPARVRAAAIRASFDMLLSDVLKKSLLAAAKDVGSPGVRGAAFCALAHHQVKEAVPIIEAALPKETVPEVKSMAQGALAILRDNNFDGPSPADLLARILHR